MSDTGQPSAQPPRVGSGTLDWIAVLVLLAIAAALFFAFLRPPAMSDQLGYFIAASDLSQTSASHRDLRTALLEFAVDGGSLRYDLHFRPGEDGVEFTTLGGDGHARIRPMGEGFQSVSYHLALLNPAQSVRIRIYPAAGHEFPSLNGEAVGSMIVSDFGLYRTGDFSGESR
jgi:hypothetical protein